MDCTRSITAKARIEIDLTRPRLNEVEVELLDNNGEIQTFIQPVEYEQVLEFCYYCKMQGHSDAECRLQQANKPATGEPIFEMPIEKDRTYMENEEGWIEISRSKKKTSGKDKEGMKIEIVQKQIAKAPGDQESGSMTQNLKHETNVMEDSESQEHVLIHSMDLQGASRFEKYAKMEVQNEGIGSTEALVISIPTLSKDGL